MRGIKYSRAIMNSLLLKSTCRFCSMDVLHYNGKPIELLSAETAIALDEELMASPGFSVDQLMELAGLSVACSIAKVYPTSKVLIVCGPGNNGGDGLVAARHLFHFGYEPVIFYPKQTNKTLYNNLVYQAKHLGIVFVSEMPDKDKLIEFKIILDCIFGFSFKNPIRPPFDKILEEVRNSGIAIVSVDIPSGWDVNEGFQESSEHLNPDMLISLTAPKKCSIAFHGTHFLGGRFLPPVLSEKYSLGWLPKYSGTEQCVQLHQWGQEN